MRKEYKVEFAKILEGYDYLWAVKYSDKDDDELTELFIKWKDIEYLQSFFVQNMDDLKDCYGVERVSVAIMDTIEDAETLEERILDLPYYDNLNELFRPLGSFDMVSSDLVRTKARNWDRRERSCWLRIYAIRLDSQIYIVTGGAIKLTRTMQEREHTADELAKLNWCREYLKSNGVFDKDSFVEFSNDWSDYEE